MRNIRLSGGFRVPGFLAHRDDDGVQLSRKSTLVQFDSIVLWILTPDSGNATLLAYNLLKSLVIMKFTVRVGPRRHRNGSKSPCGNVRFGVIRLSCIHVTIGSGVLHVFETKTASPREC
jgi:hypothetical protein